MEKYYRLAVLSIALMVMGPYAFADNASQFNQLIQKVHTDRAQIEDLLGLDPQADSYPHATSYYDDRVAHYEQWLIMGDFIDSGI